MSHLVHPDRQYPSPLREKQTGKNRRCLRECQLVRSAILRVVLIAYHRPRALSSSLTGVACWCVAGSLAGVAGGLLGTVSDCFLHYCGFNYLRLGAFSLAGLGCSLVVGAGIGDVGGMDRFVEKGFGAAASSLSPSCTQSVCSFIDRKAERVS